MIHTLRAAETESLTLNTLLVPFRFEDDEYALINIKIDLVLLTEHGTLTSGQAFNTLVNYATTVGDDASCRAPPFSLYDPSSNVCSVYGADGNGGAQITGTDTKNNSCCSSASANDIFDNSYACRWVHGTECGECFVNKYLTYDQSDESCKY